MSEETFCQAVLRVKLIAAPRMIYGETGTATTTVTAVVETNRFKAKPGMQAQFDSGDKSAGEWENKSTFYKLIARNNGRGVLAETLNRAEKLQYLTVGCSYITSESYMPKDGGERRDTPVVWCDWIKLGPSAVAKSGAEIAIPPFNPNGF
jgi:hypothetical protein